MRQRILIAVAVVVFVAGIACCLLLLFAPPKQSKVLIKRDNEVLYSLDLSTEKNRTFVIPYGDLVNRAPIFPNHLVITFASENSDIDAMAE